MGVSRTIRSGVVAALALLLTGGTAGAAVISWGPATNIVGDADVSTAGTLVNAVNTGAPGVAGTTVNGVTFNGLALTGTTATSGNFTFADPTGFGSSNTLGSPIAPFNALSAPYQALLGSGGGGFPGLPLTLTMNGLTVGNTYQFQWWWNLSSFPAATNTTATAGSVVSLDPTTTNAAGGLGQYALGTFVADAASEVITFLGVGDFGLNGVQLRDFGIVAGPGGPGGGASVPLPPAAWTGLASGTALFAARLRRGGTRA